MKNPKIIITKQFHFQLEAIRVKQEGINVTKNLQGLYTEYYKMLLKINYRRPI